MKRIMKFLCIFFSLCLIMSLVCVNVTMADSEFKVMGVGVLDTTPKGSFVDFGESILWQASFSHAVFPGDASTAENGKLKIYAQGDFGEYIVINGKTVNQWNMLDYNCVTIHIGVSEALGVYLEFNTKKMEGLILAENDNYVTFLKGFPAADGSVLSENKTFYLAKGSTNEFVQVDSSQAVLPEKVDESKIVFDVREIGILDQSPKKGLQDFGSSYLWQINFTKDFYDKTQLDSQGAKEFVQSELGDYIYINGKSVTDWNLDVFNSVQIHVKTNGTFGQYLEMNTNSIISGLIDGATDNTVTIIAGFPVSDGTTLQNSVSYALPANSSQLFERLETVVDVIEEEQGKEEEKTESVTVPSFVEKENTFEIISAERTIKNPFYWVLAVIIIVTGVLISVLIVLIWFIMQKRKK